MTLTCFWNFDGLIIQKVIPFHEITSLRRAKAAGIFPTAIEILAGEKKVVSFILDSLLSKALSVKDIFLKGRLNFLFLYRVSDNILTRLLFYSPSLHLFCHVTKLLSSLVMVGLNMVTELKKSQICRYFIPLSS